MLSPRIKGHRFLRVALIPLGLVLSCATASAAPPAGERTTPLPGGRTAEVVLHVPPAAVVWFDGARMRQSGDERRFVTPPLAPGGRFCYDVRVSWMEGGRAVERQRHLSFRAGDRVVLSFAPGARLEPRQDLLIDPVAPAPWRTNYYYDPSNWPDYPNLRRYGYYPVSPINPR